MTPRVCPKSNCRKKISLEFMYVDEALDFICPYCDSKILSPSSSLNYTDSFFVPVTTCGTKTIIGEYYNQYYRNNDYSHSTAYKNEVDKAKEADADDHEDFMAFYT